MKREKTLPIWDDFPPVFRVRSAHSTVLFSRELLLRSLLPSGIELDRAVEIVHQTEKHFLSDEKGTVSSSHIRRIVYDFLMITISHDCAEQYKMWRRFKRDKRSFILLICGAPGVGIETIAPSVAYRLDIQNIINADTLSDFAALRSVQKRKQSEYSLIPPTGRKANNRMTLHTKSAFQEQVEQSLPVIHAAILNAVRSKVNTILYGSSLIPGLLDIRLPQRDRHDVIITAVTVAAPDKEDLSRLRLKFYKGKKLTVDEVNSLWIIHNYLTALSAQNHIPIIQNSSFDVSITKIVQHCSNNLKSKLSKSGMLEEAIAHLRTILAGVHAPPRKRKREARVDS